MSKSIEIFGLPFKPTTHCIISPIDADDKHDEAVEKLIAHITNVSGKCHDRANLTA
jgi:hypothetical protein